MKLSRRWLACLLALMSASAAGAATLSLADCLKLAEARSPVAMRGALEESRALAVRDDSKRARLPLLVGDGKLTRSDDALTNLPDDNRGLLRLEQSLAPWSPEWVRGRQREAEARAAGFGRVESLQDADLAVKALYFAILREEDSIRALDRIERELKTLLDNPTLEALSEQIRASQFGLSAAKRARAGDLSGAADYGYTGQSTSGMTRSWSVSAALRIPIFDWGRITAQAASESAAVGQARNSLEAERQKATADLIGTLATAAAHRADQTRLTALLPDVRETALASVARYRRGGTGILEVSDAVNLWLQTLLNERAAYYGYLSDLARLERLTGGRVKVAYAP